VSTSRAKECEKFIDDAHPREWIGGFLPLGLLLSLVGPLSIAWQYHIDTDAQQVGIDFLVLDACCLAWLTLAPSCLRRISLRAAAISACALGFSSVLGLSGLTPPMPAIWRDVDLGFIGLAAGTLLASLLYVLEPYYAEAPIRAVSVCGLLFGCGSLIAALLVAATYFAGSVQIETALLAIVPLFFLAIYARNRYAPARRRAMLGAELGGRESVADVRAIAAMLFAALLFFQFGSEWAIAGWLPLFLIHRLGSNPEWAILALALFFSILVLGRLLAFRLLSRISHRKLLVGSTGIAMLGYLLLSLTDSLLAAYLAILIIGLAFAPIYPLIAENLDERFSYQPRFYKRIIAIAIAGAMTMQSVMGFIASYAGMQYVMLLPALGSAAVLVLTLLIMFERHLMGDRRDKAETLIPAEKK